ncbi:type II toxin-antitoxin system RelE/ParE family toxin [Azospirillum sp.]|uniref:type II toxin-antitoxin system RelE/ParE family toxin n=1 Tax=Azospirillum sp. TaxID=34012 RepID=UPI002D4BC878|nr:type II toxin-antitoxin system RelE/ParE family toxin [Azospirillum sp.]HYF87749.1 type II toxin-antitoxin system RelE/ParE family toxin [Azospirillum sp.]
MAIRSFRDRTTADLHEGFVVPRWKNIERAARRKLVILDAAPSLNALRVPPGNHLEELKGNRKGQHSIRINDQWRLCFVWRDGDAYDVEICDYH